MNISISLSISLCLCKISTNSSWSRAAITASGVTSVHPSLRTPIVCLNTENRQTTVIQIVAADAFPQFARQANGTTATLAHLSDRRATFISERRQLGGQCRLQAAAVRPTLQPIQVTSLPCELTLLTWSTERKLWPFDSVYQQSASPGSILDTTVPNDMKIGIFRIA